MTAKKKTPPRAWIVTFSGFAINLCLGILYTWSIFKGEITRSIDSGDGLFQWDKAALNDPYAVCCLVFAFAMILAGKVQDKFGPRLTALIGGILVGIGFLWISQTTSYVSWVLGFGVLAGIGIGFGYSSATPPALKWFPAAKTGLIAGLVVSGFGLASVYIAPLSKYLISIWGLQGSMMFFGIAFFVLVSLLSTCLVNPREGFIPRDNSQKGATAVSVQENIAPSEMLKTPTFWLLWAIYFIGAGAGLMVIGSVAEMASKSLGEAAFIVVATMAIGNAGGRIVAGFLSDKIGRRATLAIMLLSQAVMMFASIYLVGGDSGAVILVLLATAIGFNYGTNFSLFPSFTKDLWGLTNFGINYGIIFTAWGVGGFVLSRLSQMIKAHTGSYDASFLTAGILLVLGAMLSFAIKQKK